MPHFFSSLITSVAHPFWRSEFAIENGGVQSPVALLQKNAELERQLLDAQVRLDTIRSVELENAELKNLLGRPGRVEENDSEIASTTQVNQEEILGENLPTDTAIGESLSSLISVDDSRILAAVLKRPPVAAYDELIIDIGSNYELSTSSIVYGPGNIRIGRVIDVLSTTAKVKLFSSPSEKQNVHIGPQNAVAVAVGRGGGQYEAQIAHDANISEGDFVTNPSINDLPFGVVTEVLSDPTQLFETVLFSPPLNIYELKWVLVDAGI